MTAPLSSIGLGCSRIGSFNNPSSLAESRRLVEHALDLGVTVIDTANIYGQGDSERAIGQAMRGRRDGVFLMTKLGQGFGWKARILRPFKPIIKPLIKNRVRHDTIVAHRGASLATDFARDAYAAILDASLRRLRTDHVDALFLHSPPVAAIRDPAVHAQLAALKQAGKVRHFGVSCDDAAGLDAALAMPGLSIVQLPYDLVVRAGASIPAGMIVIAREVLTAQRGLAPGEAIRNAVDDPAVDCALIGTTSRAHLEEAVAAAR